MCDRRRLNTPSAKTALGTPRDALYSTAPAVRAIGTVSTDKSAIPPLYRGSWRHQGWAEGSPIQTCQVYLDGGTLARKRGIDACSDTVMECSLASAYLASERTSQPQSTRIWSMKRVSASKCPFALGDEHGALTRTAAQVSAFARTPMLSVSVTLL